MNEQTTDRPTDVYFAGYEEKEVQADYALVNFSFWDSLSTPLVDRYDIRIKQKNMHIWVSIIILHRKSSHPGIAGYRHRHRDVET